MNITEETTIEVQIAEGAEVGLDKLREQVQKEIERDAANEGQEGDE